MTMQRMCDGCGQPIHPIARHHLVKTVNLDQSSSRERHYCDACWGIAEAAWTVAKIKPMLPYDNGAVTGRMLRSE